MYKSGAFYFLLIKQMSPPHQTTQTETTTSSDTACSHLKTAPDKGRTILGMTSDLYIDQAHKLPSTCDTQFWNFGFPVSPIPLNRQERCLLMWTTELKKKNNIHFAESTTLQNENLDSPQLTSKKKTDPSPVHQGREVFTTVTPHLGKLDVRVKSLSKDSFF